MNKLRAIWRIIVADKIAVFTWREAAPDPKCALEIPCNEQNLVKKLSQFSNAQLEDELKRRAELQNQD